MIEFFQGGPNAKVSGEMSQSVNNDPFKKSIIFNFSLLFKEILSSIIFYLDGHFMEISTTVLT